MMKNKVQLLVFCTISIGILVAYSVFLNQGSSGSNSSTLDQVVLSEVVSNNYSVLRDIDGDYSDYIEIYNPTETSINLLGYGLSDEPAVPLKWTFPEVQINPGEYLLVFASDKNINLPELHTNFKLDSNGDKLVLATPEGEVLQTLIFSETVQNMSYGLSTEGEYVYFTSGTPMKENDGIIITDVACYAETYNIHFSESPGFYTEDFPLTLSTNQSDVVLRYTLDGTIPTMESTIYQEPILIGSRADEPLLYANRMLYDNNYMPPKKNVFRGTIVTVQAYMDNVPVGNPVTKSYFVDPLGADRYSLPVISVTTDPFNLFDDATGIFVFGSAFKEIAPDYIDGSTPANYNQRGREWERPVQIEYFDNDGQLQYTHNLGARTFGGWSRMNPKKSLKLFPRNSYSVDRNTLTYPFFENLTDINGEPIEEFKHIILRNGGNDAGYMNFRDPLLTGIMSDVLDTQAAEPVIVFINGEYWGIYFIRESLDEYYLENHYGINHEDVVIIAGEDEVYAGEEEDIAPYEELMTFVKENDLSLDANYEVVKEQIDIENFIAYYAAEIYIGNLDWPGNNIKYWRVKTDDYKDSLPKYGDGKWRYMLYDLDFGLDIYPGMTSPYHDTLDLATSTVQTNISNPPWSTLLFRNLLKNKEFQRDFINCMADYLNTRFTPEVMKEEINYYADLLRAEIPEYADRYRYWSLQNEQQWEGNILTAIQFVNVRPDYVRLMFCKFFTDTNHQLHLTTAEEQTGDILINDHILALGEQITKEFYGEYFESAPITLEAIPNEGYVFVKWTGDIESTSTTIEVTFTGDMDIQAVFAKE